MTSYKLELDMEAACVLRMVADPSVLARIHRHLRADGFEEPSAKILVSAALAHYKERGKAPTTVALMQELRERVNLGRLRREEVGICAAWLEEARQRPQVDSELVVDLLLKKERDGALWASIDEAGRLLAAGKHDEVVKVVARADAIGKVDRQMGVDYAADLSARTDRRKVTKNVRKWGTGIPDLDDVTNGGPDLDNPLGCVEAGPKQGKSLFLYHIGLHIAAMGGVAVVFSMENGLGEALKRMDAAVSGIAINEIHSRADEVEAAVQDWWGGVRGRLHVAEMPQRTTTVKDLEAYLDILAVEEGIHPNAVITDYPKEMSPTDPDALDRSDEKIAEVYRELRAMHKRRGHIGWTAAQLNKEGAGQKMATRGSTGGAFAIEQLVDLMVAIGRTQEEEQNGLVRFGVTASRICHSGVQVGPLQSSYATGRIVAGFIPRPG